MGRNPLSIQVCFNVPGIRQMITISLSRNPLSIQVCFNQFHGTAISANFNLVVIPYQFRSVSISTKKQGERK